MSDLFKEEHKVATPIRDMMEDAQKDGTTGPLIGSIVIIILIAVGGLYFLSSLINQKTVKIVEKENLETTQNEKVIEETIQQSDSVDIETIEADLRATDFEVLDTVIQDIEKEF